MGYDLATFWPGQPAGGRRRAVPGPRHKVRQG